MEKLKEIVIDKNSKAYLENLTFGKYYLKEIKPGIGYNINNEVYEFSISKENKDIKLTIENKVIESKITINKIMKDHLIKKNLMLHLIFIIVKTN